MTTFNCTLAEFNQGFCEFTKAAGDKTNRQDGIANMHKGLVLMYLGINDATDEQIDHAAITLEVATRGAIYRGWDLIVPEELQRSNHHER